jgi:hypothetical protein
MIQHYGHNHDLHKKFEIEGTSAEAVSFEHRTRHVKG